MREITIRKNDAGQRLDKFLTKALNDIPISLLYKSIRTKKIKLNRKRTSQNEILKEGDVIQLFLAEEFFKDNKSSDEIRFLSEMKIELDVIYEDENLLLVNKRSGISVHEDESNPKNNLINFIKAYLFQKGEYDPKSEQSFAPSLCNRIDRNTEGIVICAKNAETLRIMNERIRERKIRKLYFAAVHGSFDKKSDVLTAYLTKDENLNTVTVYGKSHPDNAKKIITGYTVIAESNGLSLIEVELFTGRTHQIRAHMAYIGHPLLGDGKYSQNKDDRRLGYKYQALCSYKLIFPEDFDNTALSYLNGKVFKIPKDKIYFTKEFFKK